MSVENLLRPSQYFKSLENLKTSTPNAANNYRNRSTPVLYQVLLFRNPLFPLTPIIGVNPPVFSAQSRISCAQTIISISLDSKSSSLYPQTRNPKLETQTPKPEIRNPKPETRNPRPETRNPEAGSFLGGSSGGGGPASSAERAHDAARTRAHPC